MIINLYVALSDYNHHSITYCRYWVIAASNARRRKEASHCWRVISCNLSQSRDSRHRNYYRVAP